MSEHENTGRARHFVKKEPKFCRCRLCHEHFYAETVKDARRACQAHDFILETHASGTNIEGELADILAAVEQIHGTLHRQGSIRLLSYLKLETRTDKTPTLAGKRL